MGRTFARTLPVTLTRDELLERGEALALMRGKRNGIAYDQKASNADFKEKLEDADTEIDRLAGIVRSKSEPRPVDCTARRDMQRYVIDTIRLDTGEVIETRTMTEQERQLKVFDDDDLDLPSGQETAARP